MADYVPVARMQNRAHLALDESDTAYFWELLFLGEMLIKTLVVELLTGLQDDRERHRYALEYRLLRADGIGEWADVLDEILVGPASQHLLRASQDSQRALATQWGPSQESWQRLAVDGLNDACHCLESDFEDLSRTKVSMRNWVREFVWMRNRTRGHGAPRSETLSTICPALAQSIGLILSNAPAFSRSWAHLKRSLSGKYKVASFGGSREPFSFLTRESGHAYSDGAYIYLDGPRQARLLFTNSDLADFMFPNGNFRGGHFEILSYITDERRTEDGAAWVLPVQAQPASETTASPALDVVGNVWTNMPPRREGYVSRPALEEELRRVLADDRHPVVTLQGRGGVGKTSLSLEVLHQLSNADDFFGIIWFSARDIDLLPEGPRVVRADVLSKEDVAKDFVSLLRPDEKAGAAASLKFLTDCLSGQAPDGPFIFVFDNFETIREQGELYAYVSNAVRLPNKVLVTTRTRDFKADYPIEVRGMARTEYHTLVEDTSRRLGIRDLINDAYEDELYDESDGHPYITKVLLGEVAQERRAVGLKRVVATKDAMLDALFERSFASLSAAAQRIFLTLCSWRSLIPRIGLEAVLLRPGNERLDVDAALLELDQASLVEALRDPNEESDFLSVPLAAAIFGKKKLVTSPLRFAVEADMELLHALGPTTTTELSKGLGPRVDRLTREIARRSEAGKAFEREESVIEYIASAYPPAWLNLSRLQQERGDMEQAISSLNRYLEARPDDQKAWRKLIGLYRGSDPLGEIHARLQLVELMDMPIHELSSAAGRLNGLLTRRELQVEDDERRLIIRRLRSFMEQHHKDADATDLSRLAWLCLHEQDSEAAERWVSAGLALDPENEYCLGLRKRLATDATDSRD